MLIKLKNKDRLVVDDFTFKCCVGKKGLKKKKIEGDKSTPKGIFTLGKLYYRADRIPKINTSLKKIVIKKKTGWCDDPEDLNYNSEIKVNKKIKCEKFYRKDRRYDCVLIINYNIKKKIPFKGSAIFIHLTNNYRPTAGCVALKKKDFLILIKIINRKTKIQIT